ncbi:MAG TPA: flippase [Bacteroidia bacterium]|jgi:O-antigen/teichoic acid export membrane protein|nr:flippase [Bacteroidia bacterium]
MQFLYKFLSNFFKDEEDRKKLVKIIIPSFAIQSTAVLLGLVTNFVLARSLGASNYGVFTFAFSFIFPFVSFASFGVSVLVVRETPGFIAKGHHRMVKGLHKWSLLIALSVSITLAIIAIAAVYYLPLHLGIYKGPILISAAFIPLFGLMNYYCSSLRGLHKIILSQISDNIIRPGVLVLIILFLYFYLGNLDVYTAIYANIIAFTLGLAYAVYAFYKSTNLKGTTPEYDARKWWIALGSLTLFNGILSLDSRLDLIMLGYIKDSTEVGAFNIAHKIAMTLFFFLSVMNTIIAPYISRLHTTNDKARLQEILTKTVRWVMFFSLPCAILIISFSKWIMLYFGKDFEQGQTALIILCVSQIFSISCGPVGVVSIMTGHERYNTIATLIGICFTVLLNFLLTPHLGLTGSAIAASASILSWNIYMTIMVKKKVGVYAWVYKIN